MANTTLANPGSSSAAAAPDRSNTFGVEGGAAEGEWHGIQMDDQGDDDDDGSIVIDEDGDDDDDVGSPDDAESDSSVVNQRYLDEVLRSMGPPPEIGHGQLGMEEDADEDAEGEDDYEGEDGDGDDAEGSGDEEDEDDEDGGGDGDEDEDEEDGDYVEQRSTSGPAWEPLNTPIIMPQRRFAGMRNVETVKDGE